MLVYCTETLTQNTAEVEWKDVKFKKKQKEHWGHLTRYTTGGMYEFLFMWLWKHV